MLFDKYQETLQSQSLKNAGKEAFDIFEQFLVGLQSSNLRQKLMNPAREFQAFLKNESQIFKEEFSRGQVRKFDFAFDLFSYQPKVKTQGDVKQTTEKKEEKPQQSYTQNANAFRQFVDYDMEEISEQQDIDLQMAYGFNGDMDIQAGGGANNLMYAGIDNMNEEEMMKLAIEMSLQEKNNNQVNFDESGSNSKVEESISNSKRMEEEHVHLASGEDSESLRIRNADNEDSEEKKSMNEEQNEIMKPKDMIDENEENDEEIVKINP